MQRVAQPPAAGHRLQPVAGSLIILNCFLWYAQAGGLTLCWQCSHRVVSPAARGDLQFMHISRTLANFMMPPCARLGVLMVMLRVWSPAAATPQAVRPK